MKNVIIVDDTREHAMHLASLIAELDQPLEVAGIANNASTGAELINKYNPDIAFLDVEMPDGDGFEILGQLEKDVTTAIVFVTAHSKYAIRAVRSAALDYLLKPLDLAAVKESISRALTAAPPPDRQVAHEVVKSNIRTLNKLVLPGLEGFRVIRLKDILYAEASGSYSQFTMVEGDVHMASRQLKEFDELLTDHHFFRTHRSYLVNLNHIVEYHRTDGGYVILTDGTHIPVSVRRRDPLHRLLSELIL